MTDESQHDDCNAAVKHTQSGKTVCLGCFNTVSDK